MGSAALETSASVARLLRQRREELGLTLREVARQSERLGQPIPFGTIARVEAGKADPGIKRLHLLLRLYNLSLHVADDLLDLEAFAGELPEPTSFTAHYEEGRKLWKAGNLREGLAHLFAVRTRVPHDAVSRAERQKALLFFAIGAGSLGKYRLSREIVEGLLLEPVEEKLLVAVLVQAAVCWHWLGSGEAALAFLSRAEARVAVDDHKQRAWIFHERASTLASIGQHAEAEAALEHALAEYRVTADTFGEAQALGVRVRLQLERGELERALSTAREAKAHAEQHGHKRLAIIRRLDEGRILVARGAAEEGLAALHEGLAGALASQDTVAEFYGHYFLWKAYAALGDEARADLELHAAQYHVRAVDAAIPEAIEVRKTLERSGR